MARSDRRGPSVIVDGGAGAHRLGAVPVDTMDGAGGRRRTACAAHAAMVALGLVLLWGHAQASPAATQEPMVVVKTMVEGALAVLRNSEIPLARRRQELRGLIAPAFDFAMMSRFALGYHWRDLDSGQRTEFIGVFTNFIQDSYLTRIDEYSGQDVEFGKVTFDGAEYAQVHTSVVGPGTAATAMNYRLERSGETWQVYDVTVDNLSILANYRNQFSRVMNKEGYATLVADLRKKQQALAFALGDQR